VNLEAAGPWQRNLGSWFGADSAWHELCVLCELCVLLEDVSTGQSKFINRISRIIVYQHYVTDDVINGKLVTGYFASLKEF